MSSSPSSSSRSSSSSLPGPFTFIIVGRNAMTPGTHILGTFAPPVGTNEINLNVDMLSYPSANNLVLQIFRSDDGGVTFPYMPWSADRIGGTVTSDGALTSNASVQTTVGGDPANPNRRVQIVSINTVPYTTTGGTAVMT